MGGNDVAVTRISTTASSTPQKSSHQRAESRYTINEDLSVTIDMCAIPSSNGTFHYGFERALPT